jgi:hypothetical protein
METIEKKISNVPFQILSYAHAEAEKTNKNYDN